MGELAETMPMIAGRYRIERLLGQGGMGAVHAVIDETTGERLALKRLERAGLNDTRVALFEREYQTLASLQHPRIVRVHDYGIDAEGAYYTMELLEGDDLSRAAPMPWREVCLCLRDAASILGVLHARRLVHRDLSPRNLWRTPDGRLKLLDFGALAAFGPTMEVVGTPPLTAPEALRGGDLDARTDLYALGALGYWLLTSTHAFPARQMAALEAMWEQEPTLPSRLVRLIKTADHSVPEALDTLLTDLLRLDPAERPRATEDVVDTLNVLADLEPEAREIVESGYLDSAAFVGRRKERSRFEAALARAHNGKPGVLSFEGPEGIGRSRLLSELGLIARLSGAKVLSLDASTGTRPYGLAEALGCSLVGAAPGAARAAAEPFASTLAAMSGRLGELLGVSARDESHSSPAQRRADRLDALSGWLRAVAAEQTLVVLVDDLHRVDEESQALLAMLAHTGAGQHLLLAASTPSEHLPQGLTAHGSYRQCARCLSLGPLAETEVRELLRSSFGDAPNLQRISARLHAIAEGRPAGVLMLARRLVQDGVVQYREGAWVLPTELPDDLPSSLQEGALDELERLSPEARGLAQALSVFDCQAITRAMCLSLPGMDELRLKSALRELGEHGLLRVSDDGLQLASAQVRAHLAGALADSQRRAIHAAFAESLQGREGEMDMLHGLRVGMHWLHAGAWERGQRMLVDALRLGMAQGDASSIRRAVPVFEEWYRLLGVRGAGDAARAPALVGLCTAGYLVDQSYAKRFGEEGIDTLERLLKLRLARSLRGLLGGKLSLVVALAVAGVGLRLRRAPMRLQELLSWFVTLLSSIAGGSAAVVDSGALRRYCDALTPFDALGMDHVGGVIARFVRGLRGAVEDRPAQSLRDVQVVIDRLESPRPIEGLTGETLQYVRAGALYCNAVRLNLANRPGPLEMADEIEKVGPVQALTAEFTRAAQHAVFGDEEAAEAARRRLEVLAIQLGSGWQAEVLAPMQDLRMAYWKWDAVAMKRAAQDVALLAERRPSIRFFERDARACYALIRGRFERARDLMYDDPIEPLSTVGWARQRGVLAAAYNGLGEHREALRVCRNVLGRVSADDLDYVQLFLVPQVEEARALFGLGEQERACELLDAYLQRYADRGPLIVGYLHRARAELALRQDDLDTCERHVEAMAAEVVPLPVPSLRSVVSCMRKALIERRDPDGDAPIAQLFSDDAHLMTRVQLVLTHAGDLATERTHAGLRLATQVTGATGGFLVYPEAEQPSSFTGETPDSEVLLWAREQLAASMEDDETETDDDGGEEGDSSLLQLAGQSHMISMLWHAGVDQPVAAMVLSFDSEATSQAPDGLRRVLAAHLWETKDE